MKRTPRQYPTGTSSPIAAVPNPGTPLTLDLLGAADMLKVHPNTVADLIRDGAIPAAKVGRAYVMLTKDVLAHIEGEIVRQTASRMRTPVVSKRRAR